MESNSITTPVADTPSAPSLEAGSLRTKIISEKNRSRGRNDVLRAAAKTPIEGPTGTPREIRKALRNRFGRKPFNPQRVARRFPLHEVIAARSLAMTVPRDSADDVLNGVVASNSHRLDRVGELVSLAALLEGLRRNGGGLEEDRLAPLWAEAWRSTHELSEATVADDSPLAQVLAAEVLLASSILFEDEKKLRAWRKDARVRLIGELESRTDTDGTPHAGLLPALSAWFASLTRCTRWAEVAGVRLWNSEYSDRFDRLLRAVGTMTASKSFAFCALGDMRPVLSEAMKCSGWKSGSPVGRLVRRIAKSDDTERVPSRESSPHKIDRSSPPASQSDWGKLVISRTRWSADADMLVLAHHAAIPAIEFAAFGRRIFSGAWGFLVKIDDVEFVLPNDCDAVCWFSDADADYVELQWTTEPEIVI